MDARERAEGVICAVPKREKICNPRGKKNNSRGMGGGKDQNSDSHAAREHNREGYL